MHCILAAVSSNEQVEQLTVTLNTYQCIRTYVRRVRTFTNFPGVHVNCAIFTDIVHATKI